jgi:hypothetical protein
MVYQWIRSSSLRGTVDGGHDQQREKEQEKETRRH